MYGTRGYGVMLGNLSKRDGNGTATGRQRHDNGQNHLVK